MTTVQGLLVAQTIGEYGALAGLASSLQSVLYQAQSALRQPSTAIPVALVVVVAAWWLLRRR